VGEARPVEREIDIPGAERTAVTDFGAHQSPSRRFRLADGRVWRQYQPSAASHPVDVSTMEFDDRTRDAETRRLEAERVKLELEAREIERRLNQRWWQGSKFSQYLIALAITAALLFGWAREYLEPILRRETELNKLEEMRNDAANSLLVAQNKKLDSEQNKLQQDKSRLEIERDKLKMERDQLTVERDQLTVDGNILQKKQKRLELVVAGLNVAISQVAENPNSQFFSILNEGDPIVSLRTSYGWKWDIDNRFDIGYYILISRPDVNSGNNILVSRILDLDQLIKNEPNNWKSYFGKINSSQSIIILDYSYFSLLVNKEAPVGGMLYRKGGGVTEFYAPLSEWAKELGQLLGKD
jgi:hypothetical protein